MRREICLRVVLFLMVTKLFLILQYNTTRLRVVLFLMVTKHGGFLVPEDIV